MGVQQRQVGEILVLDLEGNFTHSGPDAALPEMIKSAIDGGVRKILLNLAGVHYVDSSGLATLVRTHSIMSRSGGLLWLCHPTKSIEDLFAITHLLNVLPIFDSEGAALVAMGRASVEITCPRCGPDTWMRFDPTGDHQRCRACQTGFAVKVPLLAPGHSRACDVTVLVLPTYVGESIRVTPGAPTAVTVDSRLDLFASESIADAVRLLSAPRSILYRLSSPDITPAGFDALLSACRRGGNNSRGVISVDPLPVESRQQHVSAGNGLVHDSDERATLALGPDVQAATIRTVLRIRDL